MDDLRIFVELSCEEVYGGYADDEVIDFDDLEG